MYMHSLVQQGLIPPERPTGGKRYFFLYGTLALPHVLKKVLGLDEEPKYHNAWIRGYKLKMWGPHSAFVRLTSLAERMVRVDGVAWFGDESNKERMEIYLGRNYAYSNVGVGVEGEGMSPGCVFQWVGDPQELRDGVFDPSRFRENSDEE
ncbi:hypothetical protein AX16_010798 [Volvariella volvacea WC 439]|nr:hypothetical protein AX16_010798 [Volvariella volvacea WC 439]